MSASNTCRARRGAGVIRSEHASKQEGLEVLDERGARRCREGECGACACAYLLERDARGVFAAPARGGAQRGAYGLERARFLAERRDFLGWRA